MSKNNNTMYHSVSENPKIGEIYENVINELETKDLNDDQITSALLAATSMGFNELFDILSKMIVNAKLLNDYKDNKNILDELDTISNDTISIITNIGKSIDNDDIRSLTERLNTYMQKQEEAENESTATVESNENESEDLS